LHNVLIDTGIPVTLLRLVKMCLNETCSRPSVGKQVYEMLHIKSGMKQDTLSPLYFNSALEYTIRRVQVNQDGLIFSGTRQLLVYADNDFFFLVVVNVWGGSIHTIKKNIET
jgi:hypothetical protein